MKKPNDTTRRAIRTQPRLTFGARLVATALRGPAALLVVTTLLSACAAAARPPAPPATSSAASGEGRADKAAASTDVDGPADPGAPLATDWIFVWVDGYSGKLPGPPPLAGFIMTKEAGRLTGSTACNRMSAGYRMNRKTGTLRFVNLVNTRMLCDRVASDTEEAVLAAMLATDAFRLTDGKLELWSKGRMVARLTTP